MPRKLTASDRSALTRLAASFPKGDSRRRAIIAGLLRASEDVKKKAEEFYKIMADNKKELKDLIIRDVEVVAKDKMKEFGRYKDIPQWPGYDDFLRENRAMEEFATKMGKEALELFDYIDWDGLPSIMDKIIPEKDIEGAFEDEVKELLDEYEDSAAYRRDPYKYYGVSRRDF
jgi:hypothetical protein